MSKTAEGENILSEAPQISSGPVTNPSVSEIKHKQHCSICNTYISGKKNYQDHLNGQKHHKNTVKKERKEKQLEKALLKRKEKSTLNIKVTHNSVAVKEKKMATVKSLSLKRGPNVTSKKRTNGSHKNSSDKRAQSRDSFQNFRGNRGRGWNRRYSSWYSYDSSDQYNNKNYWNYNKNYNQHYWDQNYWDNQNGSYPSRSSGEYGEGVYAGEYEECDFPEYDEENNLKNPPNNEICDSELSSTVVASEENHNKTDYLSAKQKLNRKLNSFPSSEKNAHSEMLQTAKQLDSGVSKEYFPSTKIPRTLNLEPNKCSQEVSLMQNKCDSNNDAISDKQALNMVASECDKQQDKRIPSENMTDRISHWINPLNSRDKAEVNRLVTEFSKSKKKENLLKLKLRTENEECNEEDLESHESLFQKLELLQDKINAPDSEHQDDSAPNLLKSIDSSNDKTTFNDGFYAQTITPSPKSRRRKKSSLSESSLNSTDISIDPIRSASVKLSLSRSSSLTGNESENSNKERRRGRRSRTSVDLPVRAKRQTLLEGQSEFEDIVLSKRRNSFTQVNKSKKHKCSASECLEKCIHEEVEKSQENPQIPAPSNQNFQIYSEIYRDDSGICVKQELSQISNKDTTQVDVTGQETLGIDVLNNTHILDVEDLMKMFAVKNVTIKKEFDDPLIEAIKNVDINFLLNVCDSQTSLSDKLNVCDSQKSISESIPLSVSSNLPQPQSSIIDNDEHINRPEDNLVPLSCSKSVSETEAPENVSLPLLSPVTNSDMQVNCSSKSVSKTGTFETALPGLSPYNVYVNISNELKKLQKEEEKKRTVLKEVDKKIEEYQKILNELTAKKIKLQIEEDNLISRRNGLTRALSQCIIRDSCMQNSMPVDSNQFSPRPLNRNVTISQPLEDNYLSKDSASQFSNVVDAGRVLNTSCKSTPSEENTGKACSSSLPKKKHKPKITVVEDNDEIVIIPEQEVAKDKEIPIIDLVELDSPEKNAEAPINENKNAVSNENFYERKQITAHDTVVNSLKVFNDYLYTCSNDYTAKRFSLKDCSQTVTYIHSKRNVLQLCIETFSDSVLVFTLCSTDRFITSFRDKDGVVMKTYNFEFVVASISSGWGKVFVGLKNGVVMFCNWKDSKHLVTNLEPIKSMSCTFQGGLRVLVILSTNGQVAVRDVERNGLLIRYIKAHNDIPLFMNVYNNYVYLSSSVVLTATDISSGNLRHKIKLTSPITGLTAYENNIFTTSFSGIVRCYLDGKEESMKMAFGAGNNSLTCIYVNQGWVFTGNRKGEIAAFKFDPSVEFRCWFNSCCKVFAQEKDLQLHVISGADHKVPRKQCKCPWYRCKQLFTNNMKMTDRRKHLEKHVN